MYASIYLSIHHHSVDHVFQAPHIAYVMACESENLASTYTKAVQKAVSVWNCMVFHFQTRRRLAASIWTVVLDLSSFWDIKFVWFFHSPINLHTAERPPRDCSGVGIWSRAHWESQTLTYSHSRRLWAGMEYPAKSDGYSTNDEFSIIGWHNAMVCIFNQYMRSRDSRFCMCQTGW